MVLKVQDYLNLLLTQETCHFYRIDKVPLTKKTKVLLQDRKTYPTNVLMFGQCVGERVPLEDRLSYGSCVLIKTPSFCLEQAKQTAPW